jgi:type II secretory pathway pseudopilin PulG
MMKIKHFHLISIRNKNAITLVEILVVSVIVSILALLAFPAPGFTKKKNQELKLKTTLDNVRQALYQYEQQHFDYKGNGYPMFPCYEYLKEYTSEVAATGYGVSSLRIVTVADMLELALLKPTVADIDKRKKIY